MPRRRKRNSAPFVGPHIDGLAVEDGDVEQLSGRR